MKKLFRRNLAGNGLWVSGFLAIAILLTAAFGCSKFTASNNSAADNSKSANSSTPTHEVPPDSEIEGLVKKTTAEFADAVQSEDFTALYNDASEDFQATYTVDQMKKTFDSYIEKKSIVVPILKKVQDTPAEFTKPSSIRTEQGADILVTSGKFDTKPYGVRFDYEYVNRHDQWKLLKLIINIP